VTTRRSRRRFAAVGGLITAGALALSLASCGYAQPQPDEIGLYYNAGWIEGKNFDHVVQPGTSDDTFSFNDDVFFLPTSLRTWNIAKEGGDSDDPIVVATKRTGGAGQAGTDGAQVAVFAQINFKLNTNTEDIKDFKGGTLRRFWESIGRRYAADGEDGWKKMLLATVVPALQKSMQAEIRGYTADQLVDNTNGIHSEAQDKVSATFQAELKRLAGGDFFCSATFSGTGTCEAPQVAIKDVDFANSGIQDARDERAKAAERAKAKLQEAEGLLESQTTLNKALKDANYLEYLRIQAQLEADKACAANPNCVLVRGGNVTVPVR
jgi:hypothetical protein